MEEANTFTRLPRQKINCDQVAWISNALDRYAEAVRSPKPSVSRLQESAKLAALLEIMETLGLDFEDDQAAGNAISDFYELNILRFKDGDPLKD